MVTFVHDRMKFGFIHVPKTGGMTVTKFFVNKNRDRKLLDYSSLNQNFGIHAGVTKVNSVLGDTFDDYFLFAFYRNSYDWVFSLYNYIGRTSSHQMHSEVVGISFEEYVFNIAPKFLRPQKPLIAPNNEILVTRLEPYENFAASFRDILRELGYSKTDFRSHNRSTNAEPDAYRSAYTPKLVAKVTELYKDDIEFFGFKF